MVRFIMINISNLLNNANAIYIPIWLDLLLSLKKIYRDSERYLHSNMVRFIIYAAEMKEHNRKAIYIPIWLDLLSMRNIQENSTR